MKKITFIMPSLGTGGAERVVTTILKYLDREKYSISLILLLEEGGYYKNLPEDIEVFKFQSKNFQFSLKNLSNIFQLITILNKIRPDIIFSTLRGVSFILSIIRPLLPRDTKFVFREENTASVSIKESSKARLFNIYYKTLYPLADVIICQSNYMLNDLAEEYNIKRDKLIRIYNPVDFNLIEEKTKNIGNPFESPERNNVVVVGRMAKQKGIDILLNSMRDNRSNLEKNRVLVHLIGDGEFMDDYIKMSNDFKLSEYVRFLGRQNNPFQWMYYADLFILPSRFEGLPNSLLEAAACNSNIITTNHPGGTREIMDIIGQKQNIVEQLDWNSHWFENDKISNNIKKLNEIFDAESIVRKYEKVFDTI